MMSRIATLAAIGTLAITASSLASPPSTSYIFPSGARRGTTVKVIVGGLYLHESCPFELVGPGVTGSGKLVRAERTVYFEGPRIPMPASQAGESYPKDQLGSITVAEDARLGHRYYHVSTSQGVAAGRIFVVGHLPEIVEQEIDGRPIPTAVTLPVTINGRIFPREDVDVWTFVGKKGQSYICAVNASRIGSPLDSRLEVVGPDRRRIAESTDDFGSDSFLRFTAPADGTYQVRIHDIKFGGLQHYVYRLTISDGPWVRQTYPLGVQRGATTAVRLIGQRVPAKAVPIEVAAGAAATIGRTLNLDSGRTNIFSVAVSDHGNVLEVPGNDTPQAAQAVSLPIVVNGRIESVGDRDHWSFEAKKDAVYVMDLHAARLRSPLDATVTILNADGKKVSGGDDSKSSTDPTFNFKVPADGRYTVVVSEQLAGRGGEDFLYRLEIAPPVTGKPGFQLKLTGDSLAITRGAESKYKVNVERRGGFNEEIALSLENLPAGVTVTGGKIPKGKNVVELKLKATGDAKVVAQRVRVIGKAKIGETETKSTAVLVPATVHDFPRDSLLTVIAVPTPFKFKGIFESRFGQQGSTFYRHYSIIRNGFKGPFVATTADIQGRHLQGVTADPMVVPAGVDEFDFRIKLPPWLEVGRTSRTEMLLIGVVTDKDGTRHKVSFTSNDQSDQTVVLATSGVVGVDTSVSSIVAGPGKVVEMPFAVSRGSGADGEALVELIVPIHIRGVSATPVKLAAGKTSGILKIRFAGKGAGPFNQPLLIRARIPDSRGHDLVGETGIEVVAE